LVDGRWPEVVERVDAVLLRDVLQIEARQITELEAAVETLRSRRLTRTEPSDA
jgi:hypothetical protein